MADNYLEKKMEDYRGRGGASACLSPSSYTGAPLRYSGVKVLMLGLPSDIAYAIIKQLKIAGVSIFASSDCGIAQGNGARIYPEGYDIRSDLKKRNEQLTHIITIDPDIVFEDAQIILLKSAMCGTKNTYKNSNNPNNPNIVTLVGGTPQAIAAMLLSITNPALQLPSQEILLEFTCPEI